MTTASMSQGGSSLRAMARRRGRSPGTVSPELERNTRSRLGYAGAPAQSLSQARRVKASPAVKLNPQHVLWGTGLAPLKWKWSPQQIADILERVWSNDPSMRTSHETIYTAIYAPPRGKLRRQLIACLRHGRSMRMPRKRGVDRRRQIPRHGERLCASARARLPRHAGSLGGSMST